VAAAAHRRDPDQGRKGPLIGEASGQLTSENSVPANFYEKALFVKPTWRL
jgi:hypothetical protein